MLVVRGLDVVLSDLAALGYDARWGVVSAENAGAPHKRERIWIVADSNKTQRKRRKLSSGENQEHSNAGKRGRWEIEPDMDRVVDGLASQLDRLAAIGNGQVSSVVKLAWEILGNQKGAES